MFSLIISAAVQGIEAYLVKVESHLESGLLAFTTVGLPEGAVRESKERVTAAIKNSGYPFPQKRITINLAPADIRKEGSAFDLPIAVGILASTGLVQSRTVERYIILGELALDGKLRPVKGALPISTIETKLDIDGIILPKENANEASIARNFPIYPMENLRETVEFLNGNNEHKPYVIDSELTDSSRKEYDINFSEVKGQENVKRALEVASAGGHNTIMIGPPGSGKTMLARRIATILPNLTFEESLSTTKIHSVAGMLNSGQALVTRRPFRSAHHSISDAGLIGGGHIPKPGEVSLAHNGVLFLDEMAEFKKHILEMLRQPLEDGYVTISRAAMSLTYPSRFMLAAAMNPCPCGYATDSTHSCSCTSSHIQKYMARISGPLLDRIDIHLEVPRVNFKELSSESVGESSETIRNRVIRARELQLDRFKNSSTTFTNAAMNTKSIRKHCKLDNECQELLKAAITQLGLSARAYDRVLKVSRTIADLESSEDIRPEFVSEAIQYRSLDRNLWN